MDELQKNIWLNKYQYNDESFEKWIERISGGNKKIAKLIKEKNSYLQEEYLQIEVYINMV